MMLGALARAGGTLSVLAVLWPNMCGAWGKALSLMSLVTSESKQQWSKGTPRDWAEESYHLAKSSAYAGVIDTSPVQTGFIFKEFGGGDDKRCGPSKVYRIAPGYNQQAIKLVKEQLAKAGVRLAWKLKEDLR
jgi:S1/P1 Nuclease